MSAVPEDLPGEFFQEMPPEPAGHAVRGSGLPRTARIYLTILALATVAAAGKFYLGAPNVKHGWLTFVVLAVAATLAHTFPVKSPRNQMYHTSVVFLVAAALLLPPELIVLIPLVQTVPGVAEGALPVADRGLQHLELHARLARGVGHGVPRQQARRDADREPRGALRRRGPGRGCRLRRREPRVRRR